MTFYERLLALLEDAGVRHVFGVPGDALNPLTEAIRRRADRDDAIRWVRTAHEEGAAFAASGAAKLTGRLQVCAGTVGPGALHLLNGLADADKDGAPVLAIMGQVPRSDRGSDFHQEVDLRRTVAPLVSHVIEVEDASAAPHVLVHAIHQAIALGGVSVLIVPAEIGAAKVPDTPVRVLRPEELGRLVPAAPVLDEAIRRIDGARRVTILAGEGSRGAEQAVLALAERLGALVIRTLKARDLYPDDHELVCGELGILGDRPAVEAMQRAELLLMVGTDYPYRDWLDQDCPTIQIDTRAQVLGRRSADTLPMHADAAVAVPLLLDRVAERPEVVSGSVLSDVWELVMARAERVDPDDRSDRVQPQALFATLARESDDRTVFTCDTGTVTVWTARHLHTRPGQRVTFCANLGSMAYALPAAVGSALVESDRPVVALCGDGAFNMLMGELLTAVDQALPVKVVVIDNGKAGLIQLEQNSKGYPETSTAQRNPDYVAFAAACGAAGFSIDNPAELPDTVRRFLDHDGPAVLAVRVDPDALVLPPRVTFSQAWSFGLAKATELFSA